MLPKLIYDDLDHFTSFEFAPHASRMSTQLLCMLDDAREAAGMPFSISSHYRPGDSGAHGRGLAVDIRARGSAQRMTIVRALLDQGFPRVGVYDAHIHADIDASLPPGMWAGVSK